MKLTFDDARDPDEPYQAHEVPPRVRQRLLKYTVDAPCEALPLRKGEDPGPGEYQPWAAVTLWAHDPLAPRRPARERVRRRGAMILRNRLLTKADRCALALRDPKVMELVLQDAELSALLGSCDLSASRLSPWGRLVTKVLKWEESCQGLD